MDHPYYDALLGARDSRKIANNTYAQRRDGGDIAVKLHATDVVTFHADGTVTYRTGGYATVTTKDRLNNFGAHGVSVYSDKGTWHLYRHGEQIAPFVDGMTFDPDDIAGSTAKYRSAADDAMLANKRANKAIAKFVGSLTAERLVEIVDGARQAMGLLGDCLICRVEHSQLVDNGRKAELHGADHLRSHIEEDYWHASLVLCALTWAGYREPGFVITHHGLVTRATRRYLKARLVTQANAVVTATR